MKVMSPAAGSGQYGQAQPFVKFTIGEQPNIAGDLGAVEFELDLGKRN